MAGEIKLVLEGSDLDPASAVEPLTKSARFKHVSILKRKTADATSLKRARDLYKELFHKLGREEEDGLVQDFRGRLTEWQTELKGFVLTASNQHYPGKTDINNALDRIEQQLSVRDSFAFIEALLGVKDDWLDAAEDISDLVNFYTSQIAAWKKLLDGLRGFTDNREALDKVPEAAAAMSELTKIRDTSKPYGLVARIEPLLALVTTINEQLAQEKRTRALASIDEKIATVQARLQAVGANADLSNKALSALQDLKTRIATQISIAQILYLQAQGGDAMDEAMALIEAFVKPAPPSALGGLTPPRGSDTAPKPTSKTTKVIRAAELSSKLYLETEADVDAYVAKLKAELLEAVRAGQFARIQ